MTVLPSVFISYSSKDVKIAEEIENHLSQNGFDDVWRDKRKIEIDWSREIANALWRSDIVLLIWLDNSSKSDWVKNEWLTARALGKPITIVIISDLKNTWLQNQNPELILCYCSLKNSKFYYS